MLRTIEIDLTYQPLIEGPPQREGNLFNRAAASDTTTIDFWKEKWIKGAKETKEMFGEFGDHSMGKLFGKNRNQPAIICGSGPSLKQSIPALKENAESEFPIVNVSCLHNFGYFEDEGFHADYYLTLDAGDIVVDDVFEGRKEAPEYYWEKTKGKTLLACITTPKKLFELWKGDVYLFNVVIPDFKVQDELQKIEKFTHFVSCGGNALGGCFYIAKALLCSDVIHFVGADFCFAYNNQFHSYQTHYDNVGAYTLWPDIYGNMRKTWGSYLQFKFYFDWVACNIPGRYVNCSEGLLGAYREGNIRQFQYMSLADALIPYKRNEKVIIDRLDTLTGEILSKDEIRLTELFKNPKFENGVALI